MTQYITLLTFVLGCLHSDHTFQCSGLIESVRGHFAFVRQLQLVDPGQVFSPEEAPQPLLLNGSICHPPLLFTGFIDLF